MKFSSMRLCKALLVVSAGAINVGHFLARNASKLVGISSNTEHCKCAFNGFCECDAFQEFMTCVARTCELSDCDCEGDFHFLNACDEMMKTCPGTPIQCSTEESTCALGRQELKVYRDGLQTTWQRTAVRPVMTNYERRANSAELENGRVGMPTERETEPTESMSRRMTTVQETNLAPAPAPAALPATQPAPLPSPAAFELSDATGMTGNVISNATATGGGVESGTMFTLAHAMWYATVENLINIVLVLICAFVYNFYRKGKGVWKTTARPKESSEDFNFGLFDCCTTKLSRKLSCLVCCCWPIRWADTMDKAIDLHPNPGSAWLPRYWFGVFVMLAFILFGPLTGGLAAIFFCLFATFSRQQFRQGLGMKAGTPAVWATDCCSYFWCSCCAIVQEGREVENAIARKALQR
mmetsp:Transcript_34921/g.93211  ORF Transcript_34921/g.93211 Transcript_34921/m.93211 type:complete len:411 (-) Transcript_34921:253-1485(-)